MWPECKISDDVVNSLKKDGNKFTKNTEIAVKTFEGCMMKNPEYKNVIKNIDGQINGYELGLYAGVEMDDRGVITKYIPHSVKDKFKQTVGGIMSYLAKNAENVLSKTSNKTTKANTTTNNNISNNLVSEPMSTNKTKNKASELRKELDSFFDSN